MKKFDFEIVDLTHTLSGDIPAWSGDCGFTLDKLADYQDCPGPDLFRVQQITARCGMGTHIDAPAHCFQGKRTVEALEFNELIADCVVIKVNDKGDADYLATGETIEQFEKNHGEIKPASFVIFHTGWDRYWNNPEKYRNNLQFPSVHESAAELLLKRGICGIGIDTLSPDAKGDSFPVHRLILGSGKYLVENVANAKDLPPTGSRIFIMPMKIKGATEAPVRLIALV